jgi:hypothetical protein
MNEQYKRMQQLAGLISESQEIDELRNNSRKKIGSGTDSDVFDSPRHYPILKKR